MLDIVPLEGYNITIGKRLHTRISSSRKKRAED